MASLKGGIGGTFVKHQHVTMADGGGSAPTPDVNKENTISITNTGGGGVTGAISHGANGTADASTITIDSSANKTVTDSLTARDSELTDLITALTTRVTNAENATTALTDRVAALEGAGG